MAGVGGSDPQITRITQIGCAGWASVGPSVKSVKSVDDSNGGRARWRSAEDSGGGEDEEGGAGGVDEGIGGAGGPGLPGPGESEEGVVEEEVDGGVEEQRLGEPAGGVTGGVVPAQAEEHETGEQERQREIEDGTGDGAERGVLDDEVPVGLSGDGNERDDGDDEPWPESAGRDPDDRDEAEHEAEVVDPVEGG